MTMFPALGVFIVGLVNAAEVLGRVDTGKTYRSLPPISNSLVNLGKMDISLHFNSPSDYLERVDHRGHSHAPAPYISRSDHEFDPCPCSSIKNFKNPFQSMPNTADMLTKILKSNDLFSFNQEPILSSMCCESHEESVVFDFNPRSHSHPEIFNSPPIPQIPILIDNFFPKSSMPFPNSKTKSVEIFFFPNKKNGLSIFDFPKTSKKKERVMKPQANNQVNDKELKAENSKTKESARKRDVDIQTPADKEWRNDFNNFKFEPFVIPIKQVVGDIMSITDKDMKIEPKGSVKKSDADSPNLDEKELRDIFNQYKIDQSFIPDAGIKESDTKADVEIQIVGDKELRNDFKTYKFEPPTTPIKTEKVEKETSHNAITDNKAKSETGADVESTKQGNLNAQSYNNNL